MSKIIKSIFIPEDGSNTVVKIPIPDAAELRETSSKQVNRKDQQDPQKQAAEILAQAQEEAAVLLQQARAEAQAIREQAEREGFEHGRTEGRSVVEAEYAAGLAEFKELTAAICVELNQERTEVIASALEDLLKIILLFAEKIIRTTISVDSAALLNILAGAIEKIDGVTRAEVRLHPADLNIITQLAGETGFGTTTTALDFIADRKLPRYSCVVSTAKLSVEASVQAQLAELELLLRGALAKEADNDGS